MKINRLLLGSLFFILTLLAACTVVPIDEEGNLIGVGEVFDAETLVDEIWEAQVIPAFQENAIPIEEILVMLENDPQAAREEFGRQAAVGGPFTFMTKGEGRVIELEASLLQIDLPPYDGNSELAIKIGPVFTGTELRDALDFIQFKDFRDVTQFFAVANELNKKVRNEVVVVVDRDAIVGKTIAFHGAFGLKDKTEVIIIPVILEVK